MKLVSDHRWNALHDLIYDQQNIIEALRDYRHGSRRLPRLFHGTCATRVPAILKEGLKPDPGYREGWVGTWRYVSNFVCWHCAEKKTFPGAGIRIKEPAIFEVNPDPRVVKPQLVDLEYTHFYIDDKYKFEGVIPPERLSLVEPRYLKDGVKLYEASKGSYQYPFEMHHPLLHLEEPPRRIAEDTITLPPVERTRNTEGDAVSAFESGSYNEFVRITQKRIDEMKKRVEIAERFFAR
jgi:hypothetical protein